MKSNSDLTMAKIPHYDLLLDVLGHPPQTGSLHLTKSQLLQVLGLVAAVYLGQASERWDYRNLEDVLRLWSQKAGSEGVTFTGSDD